MRLKSDDPIAAAIHDLAEAIREHAKALNQEDEPEQEFIETYLDGKPLRD